MLRPSTPRAPGRYLSHLLQSQPPRKHSIAFDTSVPVAAAVGCHPRHGEAVEQLELAREEHDGFLCAPALAEIYSVLTKIPLEHRISPKQAISFVQALGDFLVVVPCDASVYDTAPQTLCGENLTSGVVFDALHLIAAENIRADVLVTFNGSDFERIQEAQSPRILSSLFRF